METIYIDSMRRYRKIVTTVYTRGRKRSPRGLATYDLGPTTICIMNTSGGMPIGQGRNLNSAIGAVEAIQLIAGRADENLVLRVAPQFADYLDHGFFHGAYGRRIEKQLESVYFRLREDESTRQAVITLWNAKSDNIMGMRDYPCTVALGFDINDHGGLDMHVLMRSNDVWRGLPYDIFQFTQLQFTLARALDRPVGMYEHTAWSLHLYESDLDAFEKMMDVPESDFRYDDVFQPRGVGRPGDNVGQIMLRASMIMQGAEPIEATRDEVWYLEQLRRTSELG